MKHFSLPYSTDSGCLWISSSDGFTVSLKNGFGDGHHEIIFCSSVDDLPTNYWQLYCLSQFSCLVSFLIDSYIWDDYDLHFSPGEGVYEVYTYEGDFFFLKISDSWVDFVS